MKPSRSDRVASLVLWATVLLLGVFVYRLASRQGWTESRAAVECLLCKGHGLEPGCEVRVMGLSGGRVESLTLETIDGALKIRLRASVPTRLADHLSPRSTATIISLPGDRPLMEIDPGPPARKPQRGFW